MKIRHYFSTFFSAAVLASAAPGATLSFFAVDETTNDAWRTADVAKPDADGNNVYGTDGYLIGQHGTAADTSHPSYATTAIVGGLPLEGPGAEAHQSAFDDVLAPTGPGAVPDLVAGDYWLNSGATGTEDAFFTITLNQSASFRLGVITDVTPPNPAALLYEASIAVRVTGPGGVDSGAIDALGPGEAWRDADVDYVLFDISGDAGDVFTVWGVQDARWQANALGGVFFDTIPEPTAPLLGALGCLGLLLRRRR